MPQRLMELWTYCDRWICRHDRAIYWTFGILYKLSLDAMYIWAASPAFSYGGLIYAPNGLKYLLSNILYLLVLAYLPRQEKNIAAFLLHLQFGSYDDHLRIGGPQHGVYAFCFRLCHPANLSSEKTGFPT